MAGTITKLEYQKHTQERANVYLDGAFAFGLPALEAAQLRVGQHLSDEDIGRLRALDTQEKAYERALRFLSYRPRSQAEVERNLAEAGIDEGVTAAVIERLMEQGYLDDAAFARFWIENREQFRPRGSQALRQELRQKGVDDAAASDALADLDQTASVYRAAQPRALRLAALAITDGRSFRQKLSAYLMRRGFTYGVVREVVDRLIQEMAASATPDQPVDEGGAHET